jgi:sensor histidine kinase YesM
LFSLGAANSDGEWNSNEKKLYIVINPPFWQTWWFFLLILAIIATLLYALYLFRLNQVRTAFDLRQLAQEQALKASESEMKALRAQMNPHFVFNSLNSINAFIVRNNPLVASEYLLKFADLIRHILDSSTKETIELEKELPFLESYLKAENLRLNGKLQYQIKVDEKIDTFDTAIPSMILQPYIENAIWHGISHKPSGGQIQINFSKDEENALCIRIEDDGVGRKKAQEIKEAKESRSHESMGLKITQERLALYDRKNKTHSTIVTTDLFNENGEAAGTRVDIRLMRPKSDF